VARSTDAIPDNVPHSNIVYLTDAELDLLAALLVRPAIQRGLLREQAHVARNVFAHLAATAKRTETERHFGIETNPPTLPAVGSESGSGTL